MLDLVNNYHDKNKLWADKIIDKLDPSYQYRWQVYDQHIGMLLSKNAVWLDIGCGNNAVIHSLGHYARLAVGVDKNVPVEKSSESFVCADIYHLPFHSASIDLITLRFVIEHIKDISRALSEVARLLKPDGQILLITTNVWCPFVFISRVLPFFIKKPLIKILYRVTSHDVQPTYHKFNSPQIIARGTDNLTVNYLNFIQDVNYVRRSLFILTFFWHLFTKILSAQHLRSCILTIYKKEEG